MSATFITVIEREEKGKLYFTCETKKNLAGERDKRFGEDKKGMRIILIMIKKNPVKAATCLPFEFQRGKSLGDDTSLMFVMLCSTAI